MVAINTGEIRSARDYPPEKWRTLVNQWKGRAAMFPDDCRNLMQMRNENRELRIWEVLGYGSEEQFYSEELYVEPALVDAACMGLEVMGLNITEAISLNEATTAGRVARAREESPDATQEQIADAVGCSQQHVSRLIKSKPESKKAASNKVNARQLYLPQCPARSAEKIRAKFGDDFAQQLKESL
jgi:hypothetical protein